MSNFSPEDVRRHLEDLGYTHITERQLTEFVRDLRRLIRYEEKQKRLRELLQDEPDNSVVVKKTEASSTKVKQVWTRERKTLHLDKATGDVTLTNDSASLSYETSSSNYSHEEAEVRVRVTKIADRPPKMLDVDPLCQNLPPRPELPTKPTCSFIRPVIPESKEPKNPRRDPVKLYKFYEEQWKKQRLPGELNRQEKDLRWATREWMMGGPK